MRGLLVLCFVAFCAADVSELNQDGYNYAQPSGAASGFDVIGAGDLGSASAFEPSISNLAMGPGGMDFGGDGVGAGSAPGSVSKRFFTVSAQDSDDDDDDDYAGSSGGHKSYDVVFANAPKPSLKSVLKAVDNFAGQQQTAVYVLSKTLGAAEIGNALRQSGIKPNKPHVHFVKYHTPEEAAHAQQQIRSQYDRLGGHSENGGEESAPVQSVIGYGRRRTSGGVRGFGGVGNGQGGAGGARGFNYGGAGSSLTNRYLPPRY